MNLKYIKLTIYALFFIVLIVSFLTYSYNYRNYNYRKLPFRELFPYDNSFPKKVGKKYTDLSDSYYMVAKANQDDFKTISAEELDNYDRDLYDLTFIPAHTVLDYTMGFFQGWEEISDTNDIYLILDQGQDGVEKYRYVAETKARDNLVKSIVRIENFNFMDRIKGENRRAETTILNFDIEKIKKVFRRGDFVIVHPGYSMDVVIELDVNNYVLVGDVVIKRLFGHFELIVESIF